MQLDSSILSDFEKETKNKTFFFSNGIDLIYEVFNFDKKIRNKNFDYLKNFKHGFSLTNFFIGLADKGLNF